MKRYIVSLAVIFMFSCSTNQKLAEENAELLKLTKELTQVAEAEKSKAEEAASMALIAQQEAQRQAELAQEAAAEAQLQYDLRSKEVEELKKKLANCQ